MINILITFYAPYKFYQLLTFTFMKILARNSANNNTRLEDYFNKLLNRNESSQRSESSGTFLNTDDVPTPIASKLIDIGHAISIVL